MVERACELAVILGRVGIGGCEDLADGESFFIERLSFGRFSEPQAIELAHVIQTDCAPESVDLRGGMIAYQSLTQREGLPVGSFSLNHLLGGVLVATDRRERPGQTVIEGWDFGIGRDQVADDALGLLARPIASA